MAESYILQSTGLDTRTSYTTTDPGGMRKADNVVIQRPGVLEPRPGFANIEQNFSGSQSVTAPYDVRRIIQYYQAQPGSSPEYYFQTEQGVFDSNNNSVGIDAGPKFPETIILQNGEYIGASHKLYHDVLYVPSANTGSIMGVARIDEGAATRAGLPRGGQPFLSSFDWITGSINAWFPVDQNVAYRSCFVRRVEKNQYREYISAPSGRTIVSHRSNYRTIPVTTGSIYMRVSLPSEIVAGDFVQLYRSEVTATEVEPGDELDLAVEQEVTATDVTQGFIEIHDTTQEVDRRQSLYTNATQQGAMNENGRPPACEVLEMYEDMMFFGRIYEPERIVIEFTNQFVSPSVLSFPSSTIAHPTSPDYLLSASSDVMSISELVSNSTFGNTQAYEFERRTDIDRFVGFYVVQGSSSITPYNEIRFDLGNNAIQNYNWISGTFNQTFDRGFGSVISSSYVKLWTTASSDYFLDTAGDNYSLVEFQPWIAYSDQWSGGVPGVWGAYNLASWRSDYIESNYLADWSQMFGFDGLGQMAAAIEFAADSDISVVSNRNSIVIERPTAYLGMFQVRFPYGWGKYIVNTLNSKSEEEPLQLSGFTYPTLPKAVEYTSTARERKNRVAFSKKMQPEHVPPVNYFDLGSDNEPIIAMKSTKDALYVFKTDGIWIVQGNTPETLQVYKIGNERLLHPRAVTMGQDTVFAWLDIGVCALGTNGVVANLSKDRIDNKLRFIQTERQAVTDPKHTDSYGTFLYYVSGTEQLLLGIPEKQVYTPDTTDWTNSWVDRKNVAETLCYDLKTQAWTSWKFRDYEISGVEDYEGRLLLTGIQYRYSGSTEGNSVTLDGVTYPYTNLDENAMRGEIFFAKFPSEEAPFSDHQITGSFSLYTAEVINRNQGIVRMYSPLLPAEVPVGTWLRGDGNLGDNPTTENQRGVVIKSTPITSSTSYATGSMLEVKMYGTFGPYDASFSRYIPPSVFLSQWTYYRPVTQEMEWNARTEGSAHFVKHWSNGSLAYEKQRRMYASKMQFFTDQVVPPVSGNILHRFVEPLTGRGSFNVIADYQQDLYAAENIFQVPRQAARAAVIYPNLKTVQGGGQWALTSVEMAYEPSSTRVGNRVAVGYDRNRK